VVLAAGCGLLAQTPANPKSSPKTAKAAPAAAAAPSLPVPEPPPAKSTIVEQIVARVNDKIITTTDLENAKADMLTQMQEQAQQSGKAPTPAQVAEAEKDLLANLIDTQLLVQRASDLGMSAATETIIQLDDLRKQNHLASMEDLQKAVESQGENYEDYQQSIKNQILQRKVIEEDVAPRVSTPTPQEVAAYYNAHKSAFVRPEEVQLSEILIKTDGKPEAEKARLKSLADQVQERAAKGEDFTKLSQRYSDASSASSGGDIGFERADQLESALAKTLFALPVGGVSPVETLPNGYLILKVTAAHHAGQETLEEATNEISNVLYQQLLQPEMRTYLTKLRQDAYITVKPGYVDDGAAGASAAVDITHFQRVLPSDLPKPTDKDKKSGFNVGAGSNSA
ncbi:MAG: peptidylprolyl isomerase, partial [Terriglobales bacterium]